MSSLFHTIHGVVVHGEKQARKDGFPTANVLPAKELEGLEEGVYLGATLIDGEQEKYPSLIFYGKPYSLSHIMEARFEVYLLENKRDLYGKQLSVELISFMRPNKQFDSREELAAAIRNDFVQAQEYFSRQQ